MIKITKHTMKLEDGSKVRDVVLSEWLDCSLLGEVRLHVVTEREADWLVETFRSAIVTHTTDSVATTETDC